MEMQNQQLVFSWRIWLLLLLLLFLLLILHIYIYIYVWQGNNDVERSLQKCNLSHSIFLFLSSGSHSQTPPNEKKATDEWFYCSWKAVLLTERTHIVGAACWIQYILMSCKRKKQIIINKHRKKKIIAEVSHQKMTYDYKI